MKEFLADNIRGLSSLFGKSKDMGRKSILSFPEIDIKQLSPKGISKILSEGVALISWYCVYGSEDHIYMYVVEDGVLVTYKLFQDEQNQCICPICYNLTTPTSFIEFYNNEICNAGHVYLDKERKFKNLRCPKTNITSEEVINSISSKPTFYITKDRLC